MNHIINREPVQAGREELLFGWISPNLSTVRVTSTSRSDISATWQAARAAVTHHRHSDQSSTFFEAHVLTNRSLRDQYPARFAVLHTSASDNASQSISGRLTKRVGYGMVDHTAP